MSIKMTTIAWSLLLCTVVLSGCAFPTYLRDRSGDYASEQTTPPLTIPKTVDAVELGSALVIPEVNNHQPVPNDFETPKPPKIAQ